MVETGGLLRDARALLGQMSVAILAAASVTVLAGIAVLLGAIAAARAARTYDTVILRVLGASRRQLLLLQLAEYGLLAAILAGVALALGSGIGWLVIVQLFEFDWLPDWPTVLAVLGGGSGAGDRFCAGGIAAAAAGETGAGAAGSLEPFGLILSHFAPPHWGGVGVGVPRQL